jgi:hypothetical protein
VQVLCRKMGPWSSLCTNCPIAGSPRTLGVVAGDQETDSGGELSETEAQINMLLSQESCSLGATSNSLKFLGALQGQEVVILVDSGSSHSFLNVKLVSTISRVSPLSKPVRVQVANGHVIQCSSEFKQISWSIQGHQFNSDLKVLSLPYYDMILGMDWLEGHSPMKIDWLNKWVIITKDSVPV